MDKQNLLYKDPANWLLTSDKDDQSRLIQLLFDDSKQVHMQALLSCRAVINGCIHNTKAVEFYDLLWDHIQLQQQKGNFVKGLAVLAFLIDALLAFAEIHQRLQSDTTNHLLQTAFLSADIGQPQYVVFILRTIYTESTAWKMFFLIYDTSNEKQSHLILPVLDMVNKTAHLPNAWDTVLLCHLLRIPNASVLQRVVAIALATDITIISPLHQLKLLERLFQALNNTALFQRNTSTATLLQAFIEKCGTLTTTLHSAIGAINWKTVPFYHICVALVRSDSFASSDSDSFLYAMIQHASTVPNVWLRNSLLQLFSVVLIPDEVGWIRCYDNVDDYLHMQTDDFVLIRSINVHFHEFVNAIVDDGFKMVEQYFDAVVTKEAVMHEVLQTIQMTMPGLQSNESVTLNTHAEQRFQKHFFVLSKSKAFALTAQMILNTMLHRLAESSTECGPKLVHTLMEHHCRLAIHLLKDYLWLFADDELNDVFQDCFDQLLHGKNSLLSSFLDVLDDCSVPKDIKIKFYQLIANAAPAKNKWMLIFTPQLLVYVASTKCTLFDDYIYNALLCGRAIKGDQRIELELCHDIQGGSNIPIECIEHIATRSMTILWLLRLDRQDNAQFLLDLREKCLNRSATLYASKPRYYADSEHHRLKLRLMQTLAAIVSIDSSWDERFADALLNENNQLNVTFILECIIAYAIEPPRLLRLLDEAKSPNVRRSVFMIMFYVCMSKRVATAFVHQCIQAMAAWTMGKDFNTRMSSQVIMKKLLETSGLIEEYRMFYASIVANLEHDDQRENCARVCKDFRFAIDCTKLLNRGYFLCAIPSLTGMACDELFPPASLCNGDDCVEVLLGCEPIVTNKSLIRTEYVEINVDNVQRKMVPFKELFPDASNEDAPMPPSKPGLIVVASLITRSANLGGLSRTCEIFGAEKLILDSIKHTDNQEFQALSMTSEKWLHIGEIKSFHLVDYLVAMRTEGYCIIGAEQTANGIQIGDLCFPQKSVLLLGNEKDGIPANLLSLLDFAVEIPQCGVVRSLNVHVTGALFIWEYAKQHNMLK